MNEPIEPGCLCEITDDTYAEVVGASIVRALYRIPYAVARAETERRAGKFMANVGDILYGKCDSWQCENEESGEQGGVPESLLRRLPPPPAISTDKSVSTTEKAT